MKRSADGSILESFTICLKPGRKVVTLLPLGRLPTPEPFVFKLEEDEKGWPSPIHWQDDIRLGDEAFTTPNSKDEKRDAVEPFKRYRAASTSEYMALI